MSGSAIVMLLFALVVLFGGLAFCLNKAFKDE